MRLGISLPTTRVNWPRPVEFVEAGVDWVRVILKGEIPGLLLNRDGWYEHWRREAERSGLRLFLDLPGNRPVVVSKDHGNGLEVGDEVALVDVEAPFMRLVGGMKVLRISHLNHVAGELGPGDIVDIADGSCVFVVEHARPPCVYTRCTATSPIELFARGLTVRSDRVRFSGAIPEEISMLERIDLSGFESIIVSFCRDINQLQRVRDVAPGLGLIAKIESADGVAGAVQLADSADALLVGRADLRSSVGDAHLASAVTRVLDVAKQRGCSGMVGSGILDSLSYGESPTIGDLADLWNLWKSGTESVLMAGSVSVRYPIRAARLCSGLIRAFTRN